jgi:thioredoxin reductase (NADPH)
MVEKVIIIGSGPAGYTAAIYAARDDLDPLLIRGFQAGGQLMLTSEVENFPGFPSILGPELMDKMYDHIKGIKCRSIDDDVTKVDLNVYPYKVYAGDKVYETKSIIIASGASAKWLGLDNEKRLIGKGVSGCAVCDGPFFKNKDVVVVGGGDSAMEDASYITKFVKSVTLIHRKDSFRASKTMQDRVLSNQKIKVIYNTVVEDVLGQERISGVKIRNLKTGETQNLKTEGLFIAIGHTPNTKLFEGQLDLDKDGYIVMHDFTKTSREGVFAAGDVQDRKYKQAVIAAGWGSMAAMDARKFLSEPKD